MYDLSRYDNLFPPAAWLTLLALFGLLNSHLMVCFCEQQISQALHQARRRCRLADPAYIAHPQRRACQRWKTGRLLSWKLAVLAGVGWLISL